MTPLQRIAKLRRRALIVRRTAAHPQQTALRTARLQPVKDATNESKRAKISAAMKESWARRKREAGIEYDESMEHGGSPDSELDKLDLLFGENEPDEAQP